MKPRKLDLALARKLLVSEYDIWQLKFENAAALQRLAKQKGLSLGSGNVELLWQSGLLRADLVISPEQEDTDGLWPIFEDSGKQYLLDDRVPHVRENGWLNQGLTPKPSAFTPYFHPFRLYTLYHLLRFFNLNPSPLQPFISVEGYYRLVTHLSESLYKRTSNPDSAKRIHYWNQIAELVMLFEPLYLPAIDGRFHYNLVIGEAETKAVIKRMTPTVHDVIRNMGHEFCEELHQELCADTQEIDDNRGVHTLLRLGSSRSRDRLSGKLAGAMLVRTMAELLRRATEDVFGVQLREEHECGFGNYSEHLKKELYGAPRLLDGKNDPKREFLRKFQFDTSVRLRWYVEGDTEYAALQRIFGTQITATGVELINLRGMVIEKRTLAFRENLRRDMEAGIFSYISVDGDVSKYARMVCLAAEQDEMFGEFIIAAPDFEFFHFTIEELTAVLWQLLERKGAAVADRQTLEEAVRETATSKEFFKAFHKALPAYRRINKGPDWGAALMDYVNEHPNRPDGSERRIASAIQTALRSRGCNYVRSREELVVNPQTGRFDERKKHE